MISFNKIIIEGFGSIVKPLETEFHGTGITIIRGENGEGKTTVFSALSWCVTGKPLKENSTVETWPHERDESWNGTTVNVFFTKGSTQYEIIRCLEYKGQILGAKGKDRLILIKDGKEESEKAKKDTQATINKILGISNDLFRASIIFGQNMKRFIEEDGPTQKKLMEEALNILWVTDAKKLADSNLSDAQAKLNKLAPIISYLSSIINNTNEALEDYDESFKKWETEKLNSITELKTEVKAIIEVDVIDGSFFEALEADMKKSRSEIALIEADKIKKASLEKEAKYLEKQAAEKQIAIDQLYTDQKKSKETGKCTVCGSILKSTEKLDEHFENEIQFLQTALNKFKSDAKRVNLDASSLTIAFDSIEILEQKISALENNLKVARSKNQTASLNRLKLEQLKARIKSLENSKYPVEREKLEVKLRDAVLEIKPLLKDQDKLLKTIKLNAWMSKAVFSNTGIKTFIMDTMMGKLNQSLEKYSASIPFIPEFSINMDSGRKDIELFIYHNDNVVPYGDLSGGQKQLVNVVIAFAIHDLVTENINFNILVMDEVFENLSVKSIELASELILEKAQSKTLYLITHHQEFNPPNARILEVTRENGTTILA